MPWLNGKKRIVHRVIILDRSGSMNSCLVQTIAGFNEIVQTLREIEKENPDQKQIVTLVLFNHKVETLLFAQPCQNLQPLTQETYVPLGQTALNDAIGLTLTRVEGEGREELQNPDNTVVVTIFTDGYENSSTTEFANGSKVTDLIERLTKTEQFTFTYVGANQNATEIARQYKIPASNALSYTATDEGTQSAFSTLSTATKGYSRRMSSGAENKDLKGDFFYDSDGNRKQVAKKGKVE